MNTTRRTFIKTVAAGTAVAAIGQAPLLASCSNTSQQKKALPLRLSFQENTGIGATLTEKLDYMEKLGIVGLEPGGGNLANRVNEFQQALRGRDIRISVICAGFKGFILSEDAAVRQEFDSTIRDIIAAAGELGALGVIIVPAFNSQQPCMPHTMATREYLVQQLQELGAYAEKNNTSIILEPLNRREAFYLRQVADAASICRDVNSKGIRCMGDFWHMTWEETSDMGSFLSGGEYLQHVHVASRKRRLMPGEDGEADQYIEGFKALKMLDYPHYVSFECGTKGDKAQTLPAAVQLLREQWEKA